MWWQSLNRRYHWVFGLILALGLWWWAIVAPLPAMAAPVEVYFFHSETCPHCAQQYPLMESIDRYNDDVQVNFVEVNAEPERWARFRARHHITTGAVPRTVVGDRSFIGYSATEGPLEYIPSYQGYIGYRNQILGAIAAAIGHAVQLSPSVAPSSFQFPWWVLGLPVLYLLSWPWQRQWYSTQAKRYWLGGLAACVLFTLFLLIHLTPEGLINQVAQGLPFPLFVATIAIADGFNPCAFTVLVILLSLLTYTQRRRDMLLVGGTFIATSAVMYWLFIMLMIGVGALLLEQYGRWFLLILGLGIAIAGLINIKDYFWFKQGVSLSLSNAQQRTISRRARAIVQTLQAPSTRRWRFLLALGATVLLAIFVNLIELGCTAILPAVYMTTLLNFCETQAPGAIVPCTAAWTGLYAALYILPLLFILLSFIYSFESARLTETQGRQLKLVAGLFMLFLGLVMVLRPELLMLS